MEYAIRKMSESEYPLLADFLYDAIFVPDGEVPPPRSVISTPELSIYISGFGSSPDDKALVVEADGIVIGAAWCRIIEDYGHIDSRTPSLAISIAEAYRDKGVGKALLDSFARLLGSCGYPAVSLSVQKSNERALGLYRKAGFKVYRENEEDIVMVLELSQMP